MANAATVRITGFVLKIDHLRGVSKRTDESYDFRTALVVVGNAGVAEVTLGDGVEVPTAGEPVDWLVEASASSGSLRLNARAAFPALVGA